MKKKFLTGIFLGCLIFVLPAAGADTPPQDLAALQAKAEQGDAAAQKKLGDYYFGKNDNGNGLKWVLKAAEQGSADAQNNLGWRYQYGKGVTKDLAEARKWYHKAADQNFRFALPNLCDSYVEPMDIFKAVDPPGDLPAPPINNSKRDMTEAFNWCRKGAEEGSVHSQRKLGLLYAKGSADIKPDYEKAYFWLSVKRSKDDRFRDTVEKELTPERAAEIKKEVRAWRPGKPVPPLNPQ